MKHNEAKSMLARMRRLPGMNAPVGEAWAYEVGGGAACHVHVLEPRVVQVLLPSGARVSLLDSQDHVTRIHCINEQGEAYGSAMRMFHSIHLSGDTPRMAFAAEMALAAVEAWQPSEP